MLTHALPISARRRGPAFRRRGRAFRRFANREPAPRDPAYDKPVPAAAQPSGFLARSAARADTDGSALGIPAAVLRRGRLVALGVGGFLLPWCVVLGATLPATAKVQNWSLAWVGLDAAEAVAALATAALLARADVRAGVTAAAGGTLLLADAWFDVTLDVRTGDFTFSLLSAVLVEIPLAVIAIVSARRLLRLTIGRVRSRDGLTGPVPSLWQIPLFSYQEGGVMHDPIPPGSTGQAPGEEAPGEDAAGEEAPVEEAAGEDAPGEDAAGEQARAGIDGAALAPRAARD